LCGVLVITVAAWAGRGGAVRRVNRRSGVIAMPNLSSAAGHHLRAWAFVATDGTGDAGLSKGRRIQSGTVLECGAVVSGMVFPPVAPGSWPPSAADFRCLLSSYTGIRKLAIFFRKQATY
jgi:hypothetical protein